MKTDMEWLKELDKAEDFIDRAVMVPVENWHEPSNSRLHLEAEDSVARYHAFAQTHDASANKAELTSILIAMAKFGRQGMVSVEDILPLLNVAISTLPESCEAIQTCRTKHPNLFAK